VWPWLTSWRPVIHILQIKQIKASLHLWIWWWRQYLSFLVTILNFLGLSISRGCMKNVLLDQKLCQFGSTMMKLRRDANFYLHAPYIMVWCLRIYCINKTGFTFIGGNMHSACKFFFYLIFTSYTLQSKWWTIHSICSFVRYAAVVLNMIRFPLFTCQVSLKEERQCT
jgi:hypothetical protein